MDCPLLSHAYKCIQMEVPVIPLQLKYVDDFHENCIEKFNFSNDVNVNFIRDYQYTSRL